MGARDEDTYLSLANRLARLDKQMSEKDKEKFTELANGLNIRQVTHQLLNPFDPDKVEAEARTVLDLTPELPVDKAKEAEVKEQMIDKAKVPFNAALIEYVENVHKSIEQVIDEVNIDEVIFAGWDKEAADKANQTVLEFRFGPLDEHP